MQACLSPTALAAPSAPDYHVSTAEQSERFVDTHNKRGTPSWSGKDSAIPAALFRQCSSPRRRRRAGPSNDWNWGERASNRRARQGCEHAVAAPNQFQISLNNKTLCSLLSGRSPGLGTCPPRPDSPLARQRQSTTMFCAVKNQVLSRLFVSFSSFGQ